MVGKELRTNLKIKIIQMYLPIALETANSPLTLHVPQKRTQPPMSSIRSLSSYHENSISDYNT
jgi:hypothetical protein